MRNSCIASTETRLFVPPSALKDAKCAGQDHSGVLTTEMPIQCWR